MIINIDELQFKFKFRNDPEFPATMTLVVGQFQVRGFRIMRTKYEDNKKQYYLKPPSNRTGRGAWIQLFWTDSKDDWKLLEDKALEAFDKEYDEITTGESIKQLDKAAGYSTDVL